MNTTSIARFLVPAIMLISPVGAWAQPPSAGLSTQIAENSVAASPGAGSSAVAATPPAAPVAEKKICKMLPSSYSHMNVRTCLTEKEWKQVQESDQ